MKKPQQALASIIIRTKNEERWISFCLDMVFRQSYKNIEVIIVDNDSTDSTLSLAKKFPVKITRTGRYLPGKALNAGARLAQGEYLVFLSAHCVPKDTRWLENLLRNFKDQTVAGVYGRQEPLSSTSDSDKRDLAIAFGLDKRVQRKDSFFHNANSAIRTSLWKKFKFNEKVTNIEDRVWAKTILQKGYQIIYEPAASVYHHHGIHQNGNKEREKGVAAVMEILAEDKDASGLPKVLDLKKLNIVAVLPVRGEVVKVNGQDLLVRCLKYVRNNGYINNICLVMDNKKLARPYANLVDQVIIKSANLLSNKKTLEDVLCFGYRKLKATGAISDAVLYMNYLFPFRPENLVETLLCHLYSNQLDVVLPSFAEHSSFWSKQTGHWQRVDSSLHSRSIKEPIYQGLLGLGCVMLPGVLSVGKILGERVGVVPLKDPKYKIRIYEKDDKFHRDIAGFLLNKENKH